jgi:hypothetical protein
MIPDQWYHKGFASKETREGRRRREEKNQKKLTQHNV